MLRSLAGQGRTIFVSSHLLAESLMADELVVIGRGRMIDNGPVDGFVKRLTQTTVLVRKPAAGRFAEALRREGADVELLPDGATWSSLARTRRQSAIWRTGTASFARSNVPALDWLGASGGCSQPVGRVS